MDPLIKEVFAFFVPLASLATGAFYFYSARKHTESKEARLAREKAEAAEREKHDALHKAHEAAIQHLTTCNEANEREAKVMRQMHTDALNRQDAQLQAFLAYTQKQSDLHVEVVKLVERDQARGKTVDGIDEGLKNLTQLVTTHIIARGNGK